MKLYLQKEKKITRHFRKLERGKREKMVREDGIIDKKAN